MYFSLWWLGWPGYVTFIICSVIRKTLFVFWFVQFFNYGNTCMFQKASVLRERHDKLKFICLSPLINFISAGGFLTLHSFAPPRYTAIFQHSVSRKINSGHLARGAVEKKIEQVFTTIQVLCLTFKKILEQAIAHQIKKQNKTKIIMVRPSSCFLNVHIADLLLLSMLFLKKKLDAGKKK